MGMKSDEKCDSCGTCGMHLCGKCAWAQLVFGILFLLAGLNVFAGMPWLNGWTILGVYLGLWGLMAMTMGGKS